MEDYALVIEYFPIGHADAMRREPAAQLLGIRYFTLLEATIKSSANVVIGQKLYVGKENRSEVSNIKGRIKYSELTNSAKEVLPLIIRKAVEEREKDFVHFINNSKPISIRVHTLDLMPGIGKKNMEAIIKERESKPFESLADVHKRIPSIADPIGIFVNRIISELEGKEKYYLFTKPPFSRDK